MAVLPSCRMCVYSKSEQNLEGLSPDGTKASRVRRNHGAAFFQRESHKLMWVYESVSQLRGFWCGSFIMGQGFDQTLWPYVTAYITVFVASHFLLLLGRAAGTAQSWEKWYMMMKRGGSFTCATSTNRSIIKQPQDSSLCHFLSCRFKTNSGNTFFMLKSLARTHTNCLNWQPLPVLSVLSVKEA